MRLLLEKGIEVEVLQSAQKEFRGMGRVRVDGVDLRDGSRPIGVHLDTPEGFLYTRLQVDKVIRTRHSTHIMMTANGVPWERGEYLDDYGQPLVWLDRGAESVEDELQMVLHPLSVKLAGRTWRGFSQHFEFRSRTRKIHRLLTHATWEIGGRITGNTVLSQGQCNMPVYRGTKGTLFTTACLRTLAGYGNPQGYSFQFATRAGLVQGFDFQYHPQHGALLQFWPDFHGISSLIESPRGEDVLHVLDEYRFELARRAVTPPKWLLFARGALAEHEARDLWWQALQHVYGRIRKTFTVAPAVVRPCLTTAYETCLGQRSHRLAGGGWTTSVGGGASRGKANRLQIKIGGVAVDHEEMLYAMADKLLPRLAQQGVRQFLPIVISQSDVTEFGMRRKIDAGIQGDLHCASVCATHRFFPSDFWGGIRAWRYLADKSHALGMEIGHWFAPHFSPRSPLYRQHPEYRMIDAHGQPAGGGYGFETLVVADWNTGIRDQVISDLRRWQQEGGIDFLFVDSYSNMGMLQMNYSARMRSNYAAFARLLSDLQKAGIRSFCFESISALGTGHFGVADLRGERLKQDRAVAGQNDFGWWVGEEDMAFDCWMNVVPRHRGMSELKRILFRMMANRGYVNYQSLYDQTHVLPDWWGQLNHLYNQALPYMMGQRRLLPGDAGVRWENPEGDLFWIFKPWQLAGEPLRKIRRLDGIAEYDWSGSHMPAWKVFRTLSRSALPDSHAKLDNGHPE